LYTDPRAYPGRGIHGQVVQAIGRRLVTGDIPPGSLLPREPELVEELGVSRSAIREAIKVLVAKGLLETRPKTGTRVRPRASWNLLDPDVLGWHSLDTLDDGFVRDLLEMRQLIEPAAAAMAARRAEPEDIDRIARSCSEMAGALDDPASYYAADLVFHTSVFLACHNQFLERLASIVRTVIEFSFKLQRRSLIKPEESIGMHRAVLEAIERKDSGAAQTAMGVILARAGEELDRFQASRTHDTGPASAGGSRSPSI